MRVFICRVNIATIMRKKSYGEITTLKYLEENLQSLHEKLYRFAPLPYNKSWLKFN